MRTALRLAWPVALACVVLIVLLPVQAIPTGLAFAIFIMLLTAIALRELIRSCPPDNRKSGFEAALRNGRTTNAPEASAYEDVEDELELGLAYADHAHRTLIPLVRSAAAARLSMRHGIELVRQPEVARRLLGEQTWSLIRPDLPPPSDGLAAGPREEDIAAVVTRLESL